MVAFTVELEEPPEGAEALDSVCSNCDHVIDEAVAAKLKTGNYVAAYPAWNCYSIVWYDSQAQVYKAQVMRFHEHVATLTAPDVQGIHDQVCERWGDA